MTTRFDRAQLRWCTLLSRSVAVRSHEDESWRRRGQINCASESKESPKASSSMTRCSQNLEFEQRQNSQTNNTQKRSTKLLSHVLQLKFVACACVSSVCCLQVCHSPLHPSLCGSSDPSLFNVAVTYPCGDAGTGIDGEMMFSGVVAVKAVLPGE